MQDEKISNALNQLRDAISQLSSELERSQEGFRGLDTGQEKLRDLLTKEYAETIAARFEKCESLLRELDARTRVMSSRFEQEIEAMSQRFLEQQKQKEEEEQILRALKKLSGETAAIDGKILRELRER